MAAESGIGWTDGTWNPFVGCSIVSPACTRCYAMRTAAWLARMGNEVYRQGIVEEVNGAPVWTGKIVRNTDKAFYQPLANGRRTRESKKYFWASMSDVFHPNVPEALRLEAFEVVRQAHWHRFLVLTKRPDLALEWFEAHPATALGNIWMGVTVEAPSTAWRLDFLRDLPFGKKWVSMEPMLAPMDHLDFAEIGWIVTGGESSDDGRARTTRPDWVRAMRDMCATSAITFFHKQWGDYRASNPFCVEKGLTPQQAKDMDPYPAKGGGSLLDGQHHFNWPQGW